jgi:hypothetical protein
VGSVGAAGAVGLAALAALLAVLAAAVGTVCPPDDRPIRAQDGVLLVAAHPLMQLGRRPFAGGEGAGVERHKRRVQGRVAGRPARSRAAATARCRTASGLRAGMPRPWRVKALRSDGQVVPSS